MIVRFVAGGGFDANQWLVLDSGEALLVDTGTGIAAQATIEAVERLLGDRRLVGIYLTHEHADHVGGAARVQERFDAPVLAPRAIADAVRKGDGEATLAAPFGLQLQPVGRVEPMDPGQFLTVGDERLEVLHTPGHTAAHTSLWHEPTRTLLSGDAVFTEGAFGRVDLPTGSADAMLETLEHLAALEPRALYAGHLEPAPDDAARWVRLALQNARSVLGDYS